MRPRSTQLVPAAAAPTGGSPDPTTQQSTPIYDYYLTYQVAYSQRDEITRAKIDAFHNDKATREMMAQLVHTLDTTDKGRKKARALQLLSASDAAAMQSNVESLVQQGELQKAEPLMHHLAWNAFMLLGPDHPITLQSVFNITAAQFQQGRTVWHYYTWLLPRYAAAHGFDNPDLLQMVREAAVFLYKSRDPRDHADLSQVVADVAGTLPQGWGWGIASTLPVDEEAYSRHCAMMFKAHLMMKKRECLPLAKEMLTRCVAYFDSVGPHWLCSPRKACASRLLTMVVTRLEGAEAALAFVTEAKRVAQRELGANHEATLDLAWEHAVTLLNLRRDQQALSMLQKTLRGRQECLGPRHVEVLQCQATMGMSLIGLKKHSEAEAMLRDAWETAIKVEGPDGFAVHHATVPLWMVLMFQDKEDEAKAFRKRAKQLGCDVKACDIEELDRMAEKADEYGQR